MTDSESPLVPTLSCLVCKKELKPIFDLSDVNQPEGGTCFKSHGHYGSCWDPDDGSFLEFNICNNCLRDAIVDKLVLTYNNEDDKTPTTTIWNSASYTS